MKAFIIKTMGKIFIKSDYSKDFVSELKRSIPAEKRRWNSAFSMGFFHRLMSGVPKEKLGEKKILEEIKEICHSGDLKKTWEVDKYYYKEVKDLCLKYFLEVYERDRGQAKRILASETIGFSKINMHQKKILEKAKKYEPGKIVSFKWNFEVETSPHTGKDNLHFQFYSPPLEKWFYATNFSSGPKKEIAPGIKSQTRYFKPEYSDEKYSYIWKGLFFCPEKTLFKFREKFYIVLGEDRLGFLGEDRQGWAKANQIVEYQKILLKLEKINTNIERMEVLNKSKSIQITDMELNSLVKVPSNSLEIIE